MPADVPNPYPMPTPDEIAAWMNETDPATASARFVMCRAIGGLMQRPYLRGDCDHAPVLKGVRQLTEACWNLAMAVDRVNQEGRLDGGGLEALIDANAEMVFILEGKKDG